MNSIEQRGPVDEFLATYERTPEELLDADSLSAPGLFEGEREFIEFADRDYETDRDWAFQIKREECALIVVDLQEDFVNPANPMCVPEAYRQIPRVLRLIAGCRELGVPVLFTEHSIASDCSADFYEYWPPIAAGAIKEGAADTKVYHELQPLAGERVISVKHTYDSFAGTDLDYVLRDRGVRTVIVCGTLTNFCCESTARTAYFLNYHVVFGFRRQRDGQRARARGDAANDAPRVRARDGSPRDPRRARARRRAPRRGAGGSGRRVVGRQVIDQALGGVKVR